MTEPASFKTGSLSFIEVLATSIALIGPSMSARSLIAPYMYAQRRQRNVARLRVRRGDARVRRAEHQSVRPAVHRRGLDVRIRGRKSPDRGLEALFRDGRCCGRTSSSQRPYSVRWRSS